MTTSDQEEQAERRRVLLQDADLRRQQQASTFLAQTHIDDAGGRFAAVNAATIVGSEPAVKYPQLPENNPWRSDPVPDEPPLGYRIDAMPELEPSYPAQVTDDPAHAPSGGSLVQQPSGGLVSERAGSSFSQLGDPAPAFATRTSTHKRDAGSPSSVAADDGGSDA